MDPLYSWKLVLSPCPDVGFVLAFILWFGQLKKTKNPLFLAENIVQPLHDKNKNYYFHRRFRRVPNIDECELGDEVCFFEANEQFKRDK